MNTKTEDPSPISQHRSGAMRILWRCYRYLRPYWRSTAAAYLALLLSTGLTVIIPQLIRWIVDSGIRGHDTRLIVRLVLALIGLTLVKGGLSFVQGRWIEMSSQGVAYDLRSAIHQKLSSTIRPRRASSSLGRCRTWSASAS
jgi:ABC-type multidrug transport system fused ATPase/permease subunit